MLSGGAETLAPRARWSWIFACGVALVVLGLLALGNLVNATLVTTALLGLLLVVAGVVELFAAFAGRDSGGWRFLHAVLGVIYVFVGFNVFVDPLRGAVALTIVVGAMLVIDGGVRIANAFIVGRSFWMSLIGGVVNLLLGLWIVTGIPYSGVAIGFFVGLMLIVGGISWMVFGWTARSGALAPGGSAA